MEDLPPGGAWSLVVERSVMTLPQFWFAPFAKALLETPPPGAGGPLSSVGTGGATFVSTGASGGPARAASGAAWVCAAGGAPRQSGAAVTWAPSAAWTAAFLSPSHASEIDDAPPGGAWSRVVERSVMTLPQFWFAPLANALLETFIATLSAQWS
eukprot:CAMPEP_0185706714 /NCGR_PEP_ID=MMETSP1164-20130828/22370_1 /TAXON_ID=1104430 /ORGANISM="Chrysoreinhardia sp, Strain CCMP2950" /LENGTH=154 /DNA_ID=CAMNT_0028374127 /DNA_START=224 /DNA_END=685 /DNA_ORIENTATION=+